MPINDIKERPVNPEYEWFSCSILATLQEAASESFQNKNTRYKNFQGEAIRFRSLQGIYGLQNPLAAGANAMASPSGNFEISVCVRLEVESETAFSLLLARF